MTSQASHITVPIIGKHCSPLTQKFGTPRQPNLVNVSTYIEMLPPFNDRRAFAGIDGFSHLWITWQFHHNHTNKNHTHKIEQRDDGDKNSGLIQANNEKIASFRPQVRPPRLGGNQKLGVFATRSMYRPSELGLSVVRFDRIEVVGNRLRLYIIGADMIDGTPIVDIKPYIVYSDAIADAESGYAMDKPMSKLVRCSYEAQDAFGQLIADGLLTDSDVDNIHNLIAQDPRPAYKSTNSKVFVMRYGRVDVGFRQVEDASFEIVTVICWLSSL